MTDSSASACSACGHFNPSGQKFCGNCGSALRAAPVAAGALPDVPPAEPAPEPVEEERRLLTAIFCDLVGFTPLTESLDPEDVRRVQGMYFTKMSAELKRFGGSVEKYAGDAVLALFGNPVAHEDDAERAVRCALAMQEAFNSVAEMAKREYGRDIALRIGVNTGELISGAWDIEGRLDYSATGDALNTAARLQTAADPGGIIVGPETMRLARRAVRFGPRRDLTLKGKSELFPAYPVLGLRAEVAERWEMHEQQAPLVGRQPELAFLLERWAQVQTGEGRLITVVAEAGVGKSRLLAEAVERMNQAIGTVTIRGRSLSYGESMSLHLIADLLRSICQVREGDSQDRVHDQTRTAVDSLLAPYDVETRDAAVDVLGTVLGLPPGISTVTHASPQVRRQTLIRSLQLMLSALSIFKPAIVLLEDLHWVDQASVEVLEAVLPAVKDRQAIVLTTHRPVRSFPWEGWPEHDTLQLEPLNDGNALALARAFLGGLELEPALEQQVTDRAGGNPFFVEELLRSMQETGALEERDHRMALTPGAAEKLPSTLTELLLARLDQLDRPARSTAQLGSVIGRTFAVPLLARVSEQRIDQLQPPLDTLERAEIAFPREGLEPEYVFKHATIREVAYNALLLRRRQALHAATARAIIELYPTDDHVDIIAYHFSRTRQHAEAATWLERAGDRAASVYANAEAIEQYREARRRQDMIGASPTECARVDEKLGHILRVAGRYDEALTALNAAADAHRQVHDTEAERRITAEMGRVHRAQGTPSDGIARITQLLDVQSDAAPTSGLAALNVVLARLYFNTGRYQEDFDAASRGSELARIVADPRVLAEAEMVRGTALYYLRRIEDALSVMEGAIPLAEAVGDFEVLSILLGNISVIYRDTGDLQRSLHFQERSAHLTDRTGDLANHAFALMCMGEITFLLGDWNGAVTYLERSRAIVRSLGPSWFAPYPPLHLGRIAIARGEHDAALEHIEEALSIAREVDNYQCIVLAHCYLAEIDLLQERPDASIARLAEVLRPEDMEKEDSTLTTPLFYSAWAYLEAGDLPEAAARAKLAVKWLTEEQSVIELIIAKRIDGMVAAAQGDFEQASNALEESIALAQRSHYLHVEGCALYEYGMILLQQGRRDQGLPRLGEALRIFQNLGAQPYIDRVGRALIQGAA